MSSRLLGSVAGTSNWYVDGRVCPLSLKAAPACVCTTSPLITSSILSTPRCDSAFAANTAPSGIPEAAGITIDAVGGTIVVVPAPSTASSFWCEFCVGPQRHARGPMVSPQTASLSRKNFCPPQSVL